MCGEVVAAPLSLQDTVYPILRKKSLHFCEKSKKFLKLCTALRKKYKMKRLRKPSPVFHLLCVQFSVLYIVRGVVQVGFHLRGTHLLDDPGGHAHRHGIIRDDHALRHKRPCPDDAVFAHHAVVQQCGVHPDEAAVPYGAPGSSSR